MPPQLTERRRKEIASLNQRKYRERFGQMLIEGFRSVESAIQADAPLVEILIAGPRYTDARVRGVLDQAGVPVHVLTERELAQLSDVETNQGVIAVARIQLLPEDRLQSFRSILVLDAVQDPGNVGTIIRTAAWFGVDAIVAGPGTVDFFNPKVVRAAMGGLWDVHLSRVDDLSILLDRMAAAGFHRYGADLEGTRFQSWFPEFPSVLILGSEAHGISPAVAGAVDDRITIPGNPRHRGAESLNVAIAAGILMQRWLGG